MTPHAPHFEPLREQLLAAARRFAPEAQPLSEMLTALIADVERAAGEPLELFPVCHHSPSSALHLVRRLRERPPKVIYLEACEDLTTVIEHIRACRLPVALQAFASESEVFPSRWTPLSVVLPLTEASAEYQAIAYALRHSGQVELVGVDRAVDFVFQWMPREEAVFQPREDDLPSEEAGMHGTAIGLQLGRLEPTFEQFLEFLLRNANVRHFAEWWDQYVEQAVIGADYQTYRNVLFLIGSLFRRLGRQPDDLRIDELRERYMWTRIKQHLAAQQIDPQDALYVCGAAHTVSPAPEFGVRSQATWPIPARTNTPWLYGLLPSSFAAIEYQFGSPPGTVAMADTSWKKALHAVKIKPFTLTPRRKKSRSAGRRRKAGATTQRSLQEHADDPTARLLDFLTRPPALAEADEAQLIRWCADIVTLARKNGYLASTADAIAIYEAALLLANLRNRPHPSPYDFQDAVITCLEKDRAPQKRTLQHLCQILLGGDLIGMVGYKSLPPLVQNIYDRLVPLSSVNLTAKTVQRALMDFKAQPELRACSDVLWRLHYLLGNAIVQPIMGERALGQMPVQESWDIRIGKHQGAVIQLGYEGVTLEQVLEQRLKRAAFDPQARASAALTAAEDSVLYLDSPRLTQELGERVIHLLTQETGAEDAPAIFGRVRRLVHYYRATPGGAPDWIQRVVATGYAHYTTLLPQAFADRGATPEQIAGMLGFIFTLESLALGLGCQRSQLVIAIRQAGPGTDDPGKLGLLRTAEWLLNLCTLDDIRAFFQRVLTNPLMTPAFPDYFNGFLLALDFAPRMAGFLVEMLSQVFGHVSDDLLLPWLPILLLRLRAHRPIAAALLKEAAAVFPDSLSELDEWQATWETQPGVAEPPPATPPEAPGLSETEQAIRAYLIRFPASTEALARLLTKREAQRVITELNI